MCRRSGPGARVDRRVVIGPRLGWVATLLVGAVTLAACSSSDDRVSTDTPALAFATRDSVEIVLDDQRTKLASVPEGFRPTLVTWDTQGRRVGWLAAADTLDRWAFGVASPGGRGDVMEIVDVQILDIALVQDTLFAVEAHGRLFRYRVTESPDGQMTIGEAEQVDLGESDEFGKRLAVEVESLPSGVLVAFSDDSASVHGGPGGFLVLEDGQPQLIVGDLGPDDPWYNTPPGELVVLPGGAFAYTGHSLVSAGIGCDISAKVVVRSLTTDEITAHYPKPLKEGYGGRKIVALGRTDDDRLLVSTLRIDPECADRDKPLPSTLYEVSREGISEIASGVLWASERSGQIAALRASTSKADVSRPSLPGGDLLVGDSIDDADVVATGVFAAAWAPG